MGALESRPVAGDGHSGILTVLTAASAPARSAGASTDDLATATNALPHPPPLLGTASPSSDPDWAALLTAASATGSSASTSLSAAADAAAAAIARLTSWATARTALAAQRQGVVTDRVRSAEKVGERTAARLNEAQATASRIEAAAAGLADVAGAMAEVEARCAAAGRSLEEVERRWEDQQSPSAAAAADQ